MIDDPDELPRYDLRALRGIGGFERDERVSILYVQRHERMSSAHVPLQYEVAIEQHPARDRSGPVWQLADRHLVRGREHELERQAAIDLHIDACAHLSLLERQRRT